jgi:hypothetical protein
MTPLEEPLINFTNLTLGCLQVMLKLYGRGGHSTTVLKPVSGGGSAALLNPAGSLLVILMHRVNPIS